MIGTSKNIWGFDPRSVPGCSLWLDAADSLTITLSGTDVTQWNDKSGNARHVTQVTTGLRPTYSSASNAIVFDGTRYLDIPNALAAITPTYTIFVVEKRASDQARFFVGGRVGSGGVALILGYNSSTISHHTTAAFSDMQVTIPSYLGASEPVRVTRFAYTGSTRSTFINGGQFSNSQGFSSTLTTWNTANIGAGFNTSSGNWYIGNVYEILFYNATLTSQQNQQVEGYLAHKWGLSEYYSRVLPLTIPGCTIWLDGEDPAGTGTPPSAGTLATWVDKSGNGRNAIQYSTLARPTFVTNSLNSRGGVSFSAASSNCYQTATILPTPRALFVVGFSANDGFILSGIPTPNSGHPPYYATFARDVEFGVNNTSDQAFLVNLASTSNVNYILTGLYTGSSVTATMNGGTLSNTVAFSGTPKTPATTLIGINSYAGSLGAPLTGTINEFIAFNTDLTTTQRQQVEGYLARKWGFTSIYSRLPITHPYFSLRPHLRNFRPTDISECILWMDAADDSTLTLQVGNKVSAWRDKSSNGFILSNATTLTQPTYVTSGWNASYPAVQVNGAASGQHNFLSNAAFNGFNTAAWDIYAVVRHSTGSTTNDNYGALMWIDPSGTFIIIANGIGRQSYTTLSNSGWQLSPLTGPVTTQNPYLFQAYSTGTELGRRLNGIVPGFTEQLRSYTGVARTGTYPFFLANPSTGWATCTTFFAEMLMFSRTLSDSERLRIEGYLSTKWGLTQTSFSSTAFTPTSIGGCQLWFDALDTASLTPSSITTGTKVSQWNDKSGNNRHMSNSTAATQPTYSTSNFNGSLPSVFFTGSVQAGANANLLSNAASTVLNSTTWDIYVAFKPTGGQEAIFWNDPSGAVVLILGNTKLGGDNDLNYAIHYGGWRLAPLEGACRGGECQIYQAYSTGTTLGRRVNGGFEGFMPQTASFSWPSRSSNSELAFCRPSSGQWSEGNVAIAEVIVYNSVLSDANRSNVETYLTNKWRIGRGLQLGHPYYSIPPARPVGGKIVVTTFAGNGTASTVNGTGTTASFNNPRGLTMSAAGNIYVPEFQGNRVRRVTPNGVVTILAGTGGAGSVDNAIGTSATFNGPFHASVDNQENVYLSDVYNHKIRKISSLGVVTTVAGDGFGTNATGRWVDGVGTNASFNSPWMNVVNRAGTILYVGDQHNNRIRRIDLTTGVVTTVFGNGTASSVNGTGTNATFNQPGALSFNEDETIMYACDNNIVRKINLINNTVTTLAGSTTAGTLDGTGTNARFSGLNRTCVDQYDGSVYVTDFHTVRKITPDGVVTTLAGANTGSYLDGTGEVARFNQPQGIAIDKGGTCLYIADRQNHRVRKIFFN